MNLSIKLGYGCIAAGLLAGMTIGAMSGMVASARAQDPPAAAINVLVWRLALAALQRAILQFIAEWNEIAHPFRWMAQVGLRQTQEDSRPSTVLFDSILIR